MTAIEDIRYLQNQGRLTMGLEMRAILELYDQLEKYHKAREEWNREEIARLDEAIERIEYILDGKADIDFSEQVTQPEENPSV